MLFNLFNVFIIHHLRTMKFELNGKEFIELNKLLKILNWVESGGMAHSVIDEGLVKVNDVVELRRRNKLRKGTAIEFNGQKVTII